MHHDTATRVCLRCQSTFPATTEHFRPDTRAGRAGKLLAQCRPCLRQSEREREVKRALKPRVAPAEKLCTVCVTVKPCTAEYFRPDHNGRYGFTPECRVCLKMKMQQWVERNSEHVKAKGMERHAANRDELNARRRARYHADPAARKAYEERRKALHGDRRRAEARARHAANPERGVAKDQRRRAAKLAASGSFTATEWAAKIASYERRCHWCGKKISGTPQADHLIPLIPRNGGPAGTNDIGNIVPACKSCNSGKKDKLPHEWNGRLL